MPSFVQSPLLSSAGGVFHAFLGKDPAPGRGVDEALRTVFSVPPDAVATLSQIHSADVLVALPGDLGLSRAGKREGDGVVAHGEIRGAGVFTADCVPILLAVPGGSLVAAVHAGWRGLAGGIVEEAVCAIEAVAGRDVRGRLLAAVGPAARGCCYEVGDEAADALSPLPGAAAFVLPGSLTGKWMADLPSIALSALAASGVSGACSEIVGPCTVCSPLYNSFRREKTLTGRQLSVIYRI